jgi:nitrous oxidase accessory protein NosD
MRLKIILAVSLTAVGMHVFAADISVPRDYLTIQDAVDAASDGDTIMVTDGMYAGAFVNKAVHIKGNGHAIINVGVDVQEWPHGTRGFVVTADGATISHLAIENVGIGIEGDPTDANPAVDDVAINHVTITNPIPTYRNADRVQVQGAFGVLNYEGGNGWTVTHSKMGLTDGFAGYGIYIRHAVDSLIAFNEIEHIEQVPTGTHYFGVFLLDTQYNKVVHNKILIDAEKKGCVGLGGSASINNTIGFNDFRGSTVEEVAAVWGTDADANLIKANLGWNRSSISDADASDFKRSWSLNRLSH